jgi:hypothetical protein
LESCSDFSTDSRTAAGSIMRAKGFDANAAVVMGSLLVQVLTSFFDGRTVAAGPEL